MLTTPGSMSRHNDARFAARQVRVYNDTGAAIPPHSFCRITGLQTSGSKAGAFDVAKPNADSMGPENLIITGAVAVPDGKVGLAMMAYEAGLAVAYNSTAPANGDDFGTVSGQWYGEKDKTGFTAHGSNTTRALTWCSPSGGSGGSYTAGAGIAIAASKISADIASGYMAWDGPQKTDTSKISLNDLGHAVVCLSSSQSIATGDEDIVEFDTEVFDTQNDWDTNDYMWIRPGLLVVMGQLEFDGGSVEFKLKYRDSAPSYTTCWISQGTTGITTIAGLFRLPDTQKLELYCDNQSGSTVTLTANANRCFLSIARIRL